MLLQPARRRPCALLQWRSMRSASVFRPRRARKLSNGPGHGADGVLQEGQSLAQLRVRRPPPAMPPTMSEWPLRYLVAECMTMSKPCSSGRCTQGLAKVLSATVRIPRRFASAADAPRDRPASAADWSASRPRSCAVSGRIAASTFARSLQIDEGEGEAGRALAHALEQPVGAAVEIVHRDARERRCRSSSRIVAIAARPEAKAKPRVPLSRSATQRS